jgi:hypothetical protein
MSGGAENLSGERIERTSRAVGLGRTAKRTNVRALFGMCKGRNPNGPANRSQGFA